MQDDDLRARFKGIAADDAASAPDLTFGHIEAWRTAMRIQKRRALGTGAVVGMAAGTVLALTIGLVLGASTGYASAGEIVKERGDTPLPPGSGLAVLKNIPPLMFACSSAPEPQIAKLPVQPGAPIIDLPEPTTKSSVALGGVLGVRVLSNGNVLVSDAGRKQMHLFDSTLSRDEIVRDSTPGSASSYGPRAQRLLKWVGDSSLVGDYQGNTLLILGPTGQVARVMAPLEITMTLGKTEADGKGRLVYQTQIREDPELGLARARIPDSALLVRGDFETRRIDTLTRLKSSGMTKLLGRVGDGPVRFFTEPVALTDDWAQLSDGSIAVVRGRDYHVDWIAPGGSVRAGPKMPFDWKRFTDEEKQHLIDSVRDMAAARYTQQMAQFKAAPPADGAPPLPTGPGQRVAGAQPQRAPLPMEYVAPDLKDVFDFHPPLRRDAVRADLDGNVWILPTTSAQSKNGELVYDVTNPKGEFYRVRMPAGRSIAGFGKGGVVFLLNGDAKTGFYLEKAKLPPRK
jgi:hypothetical protein